MAAPFRTAQIVLDELHAEVCSLKEATHELRVLEVLTPDDGNIDTLRSEIKRLSARQSRLLVRS